MGGSLSLQHLEQTLTEIVRRHEVLRTGFPSVDGEPHPIIFPATPFSLSVIDLSTSPVKERQIEIHRLAHQAAEEAFDLAHGPLLRATLLRLTDDDHVLILTMHRIVSDDWSMNIFVREMATLYTTFLAHQPSPLGELPIQYVDFARWQRQYLRGEELDAQFSYWREQLRDVPVLQLPTDRPRPTLVSYRGAAQSHAFSNSLTQRLKLLSRNEGTTLFMTLLAAFQALLARYSGQSDIAVATQINARYRSETEDLIGTFANTLILRAHPSPEVSFRELLVEVRKAALEAYANQDVPFEELVEVLQPERSFGDDSALRVMFSLHHAVLHDITLPGVSLTTLDIVIPQTKFDIEMHFREEDEALNGVLIYSTDLFEAETIAQMLQHFEVLLESIITDDTRSIAQLPLLTDQERHHLLYDFNDTRTEYPRHETVHRLFEEQAALSPDSVAVVFNDERFTYRELNEKANRLAHYLQTQGVGPEVIVGVLMERSLSMVVALLGILKAGGAYLPLDPNYPPERLAFMLDDSGAGLLLSQKRWEATLDSLPVMTLYLDDDLEMLDGYGSENLARSSTAQNLAYVMYTSGSTGRPKGICVLHQAINRLVFNTNYLALGVRDTVAHLANISFDAATFEIWAALLSGARLVVIPQEVVLSTDEFVAQLQRHSITTLFLATPLFNHVVSQRPRAFRSIKTVLFGGDAANPKLVRDVLASGAPERLLHMYGPTESTTFATWHLVSEVLENASTIAIGTPVANTEIYVLDPYLQVAPIGVVGELHIGGDGVARGYLHFPELTAEKFIPNPFSQRPGQRLYRTGDLARFRNDGSVEFLGRIDVQVKLRGFRIELGEIEAILGQHEAVDEAVVVAREDKVGEKRLVAYLVAKPEQELVLSKLRRYLAGRLPEYMIPSAFVLLKALPLTPNGKIDRRALPAPDQSTPSHEGVEPRTSLERVLVMVWAGSLGLKQVGIDDDFFEFGGDSLIATRMALEVRRIFGLQIRLSDLFKIPTVRQMAENISMNSGDPAKIENTAYLLLRSKEAVSIEEPEGLSTLVFMGSERLTPHYLETHINPYLNAINDLQRVIDEIKGRRPSTIQIKSVRQASPISIDLKGAPEAIQLIRDTVVPWRRKHIEKMARLQEREKQAEIGNIKADILEKRARAARDNAETAKITAEAAQQREETEKMRLDNERLRLELVAAKIQLALELLDRISSGLSETEKIAFVVKLLPSLDILAFSELEIS